MRDFVPIALTGLRELIFPAECAGCGRAGALLCLVCAPRRPPREIAAVDGLRVQAAGDYDGGLRRAVLAYKERDRRDLGTVLGGLLRRAVAGSAGVLVPVPSAPEAVRRRGGDHVLRLARAAARGSCGGVESALTLRRAVQDSAGLGIGQRRSNLTGAFVASPPPSLGEAAILVDDIVTTGATLAEAARALRVAGWSVEAAAVVAATPLRDARARPGVAAPRHSSPSGRTQVSGLSLDRPEARRHAPTPTGRESPTRGRGTCR